MLTIAIRENNSHFAHGLKIIIEKIYRQRNEDFYFLPCEEHSTADIVFMSLADNWFTADCFEIPNATKSQRVILICRHKEHQSLMFRPCLYMLPVIFREDEVDEVTRKIAHWTEAGWRRNNTTAVSARICYYCTTCNFTSAERQLLIYIARGHSLQDAAHLMQIEEDTARIYRKVIMKKLKIRDQYELMNFIKIHLLSLIH